MIPAPFMARRDIVRELEAAMVAAVVRWANDYQVREAWDAQMESEAIEDCFEALRKLPRRFDDA